MSSHVACRSREEFTLGAKRRPRVLAAGPASAVEPELGVTARLAARIARLLTAAVVVVGVAVHLAAAGLARHLLAFSFPGVPAEPSVAAEAFLHNLRVLLAIAGALLVAQSPYLVPRGARPGHIHWALQRGCEAILAGGVAANVIVIGAGFGAYGTCMVRAALPHGPVELVAYSLALALYVRGRLRPVPVRHVLTIAALSTTALAAAALLETYVNV